MLSMNALNMIANIMHNMDIPYAFDEWKDAIPDRYYVGEYIETVTNTKEECGYNECTFILNGFTRGSRLIFEQDKERIAQAMDKTAMFEDGSAIAVFYESAQMVPSGIEELKRIQINIRIKEWRVI